MAPIVEEDVENLLNDVVQDLYEIQSCIHGYIGPITQKVLMKKVRDLVANLQKLSSASVAIPTSVPPEIIQYMEEGRNPDIYTREFVEQVQKNNMYLKGKSEAFKGFRDILAKEMVTAGMASQEDVNKVLESRVEEKTTNGEAAGEVKG